MLGDGAFAQVVTGDGTIELTVPQTAMRPSFSVVFDPLAVMDGGSIGGFGAQGGNTLISASGAHSDERSRANPHVKRRTRMAEGSQRATAGTEARRMTFVNLSAHDTIVLLLSRK